MRLGYSGRHWRFWRKDIKLQKFFSLKEFQEASIEKIQQIAIDNLLVLEKIIEFNIANDISVYEIAYDVIPYIHYLSPEEYPQIDCVRHICGRIASLVLSSNMRLSISPTLWQTLCGCNENSIQKAFDVLKGAAWILDSLGMPQSHFSPIIVSLNTNRSNLVDSYSNFKNNFKKLPSNVSTRLAIRNDKKNTRQRPFDLTYTLQTYVKIPVVLDTLFHELNPDVQSSAEALEAIEITWAPYDLLFYYSESKPSVEFINKKLKNIPNAATRSYLVYRLPEFKSKEYDCLVMAEGHEKACIHWRNKHWRKND